MIVIDPYRFGSPAAKPAISYIGFTASENVATSTVNVSSVAIGAAASSRRVCIVVHTKMGGGPRAVTAATIGGVAATIHTQNTGATLYSATYGIAIISAVVPSGTTANVSVTFAGSGSACVGLAVYRIVDLASGTPTATAQKAALDSAYSHFVAVDVSNDGVMVAGANAHVSGFSVTGATKLYEKIFNVTACGVGGNFVATEAVPNRTVTFNSSQSTWVGAVAAVAFR